MRGKACGKPWYTHRGRVALGRSTLAVALVCVAARHADGQTIYSNTLTWGCTDPAACNYDASADANDGSCRTNTQMYGQPVSGRVTHAYEGTNPLRGGATGLQAGWAPEVGTYTVERCAELCTTDSGTCKSFNFRPSDGRCELLPVALGEEPDGGGTATGLNSLYFGVNVWEHYTFQNAGCRDPRAENYDAHATHDSFSVLFPYSTTCIILGCNDPVMFNYDPDVTRNDGSCEPVRYGCLDPEMSNFRNESNTACPAEEQSEWCPCITRVAGCRDPDAYNYNARATEDFPPGDRFSCQYALMTIFSDPLAVVVARSVPVPAGQKLVVQRDHPAASTVLPCPVLSDGSSLCKCSDAQPGVDCSRDRNRSPTGCVFSQETGTCSTTATACANRCYDINLRSRYNMLADQCLSFDVDTRSSECALYSVLDSAITAVNPVLATVDRYTVCDSRSRPGCGDLLGCEDDSYLEYLPVTERMRMLGASSDSFPECDLLRASIPCTDPSFLEYNTIEACSTENPCPGGIVDCDGVCVDDRSPTCAPPTGLYASYTSCAAWKGDGQCNGGEVDVPGPNLNCLAHDFDGGDCVDACADITCVSGICNPVSGACECTNFHYGANCEFPPLPSGGGRRALLVIGMPVDYPNLGYSSSPHDFAYVFRGEVAAWLNVPRARIDDRVVVREAFGGTEVYFDILPRLPLMDPQGPAVNDLLVQLDYQVTSMAPAPIYHGVNCNTYSGYQCNPAKRRLFSANTCGASSCGLKQSFGLKVISTAPPYVLESVPRPVIPPPPPPPPPPPTPMPLEPMPDSFVISLPMDESGILLSKDLQDPDFDESNYRYFDASPRAQERTKDICLSCDPKCQDDDDDGLWHPETECEPATDGVPRGGRWFFTRPAINALDSAELPCPGCPPPGHPEYQPNAVWGVKDLSDCLYIDPDSPPVRDTELKLEKFTLRVNDGCRGRESVPATFEFWNNRNRMPRCIGPEPWTPITQVTNEYDLYLENDIEVQVQEMDLRCRMVEATDAWAQAETTATLSQLCTGSHPDHVDVGFATCRFIDAYYIGAPAPLPLTRVTIDIALRWELDPANPTVAYRAASGGLNDELAPWSYTAQVPLSSDGTASNQLSSQYVEPTAPVRPFVYWRTVLLVFLILLIELFCLKVYRYRFKKKQVHHEHYAVELNKQVQASVRSGTPRRTTSAYFGDQLHGPESVHGSDAGSLVSGRQSARQSAHHSVQQQQQQQRPPNAQSHRSSVASGQGVRQDGLEIERTTSPLAGSKTASRNPQDGRGASLGRLSVLKGFSAALPPVAEDRSVHGGSQYGGLQQQQQYPQQPQQPQQQSGGMYNPMGPGPGSLHGSMRGSVQGSQVSAAAPWRPPPPASPVTRGQLAPPPVAPRPPMQQQGQWRGSQAGSQRSTELHI